jgi:hypothetical protein
MLTSVVKWFGELPGGVKKFLVILAAAVVVGGPLLMFMGAVVRIAGAVLGAIGWITRLGTASEVAAGAEGAGGLAAFSLALSRVIPVIGLFMVALALKNRVKPTVKRTLDHALHPGRDTQNDLRSGHGSYGMGAFGNGTPHFGGGLDLFGIHIPFLATGGTVLGGGLAMVGEAGPELLSLPRGATVTPNIGPSGYAGNLMSTTFPGMPGGGSSNEDIVVQVVLDGRVIAQSVNQRNRKNQNRR